MTNEEFIKIAKLIKGLYPNMNMDENVYAVWRESFSTYSYEDVVNAIKKYSDTQKYAPAIADIKELVKTIPHKMVASSNCKECGGSGRILVNIMNEEIKSMYGDIGAQEFCVTCPTCRGWRYVTREEAERNGKR